MIDFIRPPVRAALRRWGETLIALAIAALGLWLVLGFIGLFRWLGWAVIAAGVGLGFAAVQRARFAAPGAGADPGAGPGMVQVIEGEIRYFGPSDGGFAAVDAITALGLSADASTWLIATVDGRILAIPRAASGAEALFDAFESLPGLSMERLLRDLARGAEPQPRMIWQRTARAPLT